MSQPLFVIVSDDESGGDNSVHTAVLDDSGNQKIVALEEANQFRQIPKEPKFSVVPRSASGLAQWNAQCKVTRYKCDMCDDHFSKPYLLRNHRHRVHNICLEAKSVPSRKGRGRQQDDKESQSATSDDQTPNKDLVPKHNPSAEEVRTEKLEKLVVKDSSVAIQIAAELEKLKKSEPKRPRYISHKKYPCQSCGKPFASPSLLERHRSVHTRERLYPCPHCPKKCAYTDERLRHIRRAHPEKVSGDKTLEKCPSFYTCNICDGKTFTTKYRYTEHLKVHLNGLFECQICNKKYAKRDNLVRHLQIHNGEKSYECETCHKRFLDAGSLRSHQQTHTGDYRYKCGVCEKGFSKKKSLYDHLQRHNEEGNNGVFECKVCWECLDSKEELEAHQDLHLAGTSPADPVKEKVNNPPSSSASTRPQLSEQSYCPQVEASVQDQSKISNPSRNNPTEQQVLKLPFCPGVEHVRNNPTEFSGQLQNPLNHLAERSAHVTTDYSSQLQNEHSQNDNKESSAHVQREYLSQLQNEHSQSDRRESSAHVQREYSNQFQNEHSQRDHRERSVHVQREYSNPLQNENSPRDHRERSSHVQRKYSSQLHEHSQHNHTGRPAHIQPEFSDQGSRELPESYRDEHSSHPQIEYSSHHSVNFPRHSVVDLSGQQRLGYTAHPQNGYLNNALSHGRVSDLSRHPQDLVCHICNKSFQSPNEARLHARLHNMTEPNTHNHSYSYMNVNSEVPYGGVSSSSVYATSQMPLDPDQTMAGTQHSHLLI